MATSKAKKAAGGPLSLPAGIRQGVVLGGRWRLGRLLGKGACASVFEGARLLTRLDTRLKSRSSPGTMRAAEPVNGADAGFPIVAKLVPTAPPAASKKKKPTEAMAIADTLYHESVVYNVRPLQQRCALCLYVLACACLRCVCACPLGKCAMR